MTAQTITVAEWEQWLGRAATGDRIVYAAGWPLPRASGAVILAREAAQVGLVRLARGKADGMVRWSAERVVAAHADKAVGVSVERQVLAFIRDRLTARLGAPSNGEIAKALKLASPDAARYALRKLVNAGLIDVINNGVKHRRSMRLLSDADYSPALPMKHRTSASVSCKSWCYFIGGNDGPIKIGCSTDVAKRLRALQIGSAYALAVLAVIEGNETIERRYHRQFAHLRLNGEWFRRDTVLLNEIERINALALAPTC